MKKILETFGIASKKGFALLIAVIFMSVMLAIGLALSSLGYKQQVLATSSINSQYAFYSADAALECALYADQKLATFDYTVPNFSSETFSCDGGTSQVNTEASATTTSPKQLKLVERVNTDSDTRCADVTIYKPGPATIGTTTIFALGYNISCNTLNTDPNATYVARGLEVEY